VGIAFLQSIWSSSAVSSFLTLQLHDCNVSLLRDA